MVQIKDRVTGLYDRKGFKGDKQWTNKAAQRGTWATVAQAKSHVTLLLSFYNLSDKDTLIGFMNADFIVLNDEYSKVETIPVSTHVVPKLLEFIKDYQNKNYAVKQVTLVEEVLTQFGIPCRE